MYKYEKSKQIARAISTRLNCLSIHPDDIALAMSSEHKTLQQIFTNICIEWLTLCASDEYGRMCDGRNEASHKIAKEIINGRDIPRCPFI